jgi:hypothetical protein
MKWRMYADRILGIFEGNEPGKEYTVAALARELEINRPEVQNAVYQMCKAEPPQLRCRQPTTGRSHAKYYSLPEPDGKKDGLF